MKHLKENNVIEFPAREEPPKRVPSITDFAKFAVVTSTLAVAAGAALFTLNLLLAAAVVGTERKW